MGHVIFHIALLSGSFILMHGPEKNLSPENKKKVEQADALVSFTRWMHGYVIASRILRVYLFNAENRLIIRFIRVIAYGVYFVNFLFLQYYLTSDNPSKSDPMYVLYAKYFLQIEVVSFYAQVATMSFFLLWITFRGQCGYKNYKANKNRYKFDALQYYKDDVQWLSFQFVPFFYKLIALFDRTHICINGNCNPLRDRFMVILLVTNTITFYLLQPARNQFR